MATIEQFTRALLIIRKIRSQKPAFPTQEEIRKYIDGQFAFRDVDKQLSERTFFQDKKNIKQLFRINIEHSKKHGGYYIENDLNNTVLDVEAILEPFEIFNALQLDSGLSDFIVAEAYRPKNTHYLVELVHAIKKSVEIKFTYSKFDSDQASERRIEPYILKQFNGRWYVIGKVSGRSDIKTFGLDRIENLLITATGFKKNVDFDVVEKFKNSFGIYSSLDHPVEDIVLAFDAIDGNYLKSVPLHSSQTIIADNETEFVISLQLRITHDFVMEILSRSNSLKVIKPNSLKERVRAVYLNALQRNN